MEFDDWDLVLGASAGTSAADGGDDAVDDAAQDKLWTDILDGLEHQPTDEPGGEGGLGAPSQPLPPALSPNHQTSAVPEHELVGHSGRNGRPDEARTRVRLRNRRNQANVRARVKGLRQGIEQQIERIRTRLAEQKEVKQNLRAQHGDLTLRVLGTTNSLLSAFRDVRNQVAAPSAAAAGIHGAPSFSHSCTSTRTPSTTPGLHSTPQKGQPTPTRGHPGGPGVASRPASHGSFSLRAEDALRVALRVRSDGGPRDTPAVAPHSLLTRCKRPFTSFLHHHLFRVEDVLHFAHVTQRCGRPRQESGPCSEASAAAAGVDLFLRFSESVTEWRHAVALGQLHCQRQDVCWMLRFPYEVAAGVPLSCSTHLGSAACGQSAYAFRVLMHVEVIMLHEDDDFMQAACTQAAYRPGLVIPEQAGREPSAGPTSTCETQPQEGDSINLLRCGAHQTVPLEAGLQHAVSALLLWYHARLPPALWTKRARTLHGLMHTVVEAFEHAVHTYPHGLRGDQGYRALVGVLAIVRRVRGVAADTLSDLMQQGLLQQTEESEAERQQKADDVAGKLRDFKLQLQTDTGLDHFAITEDTDSWCRYCLGWTGIFDKMSWSSFQLGSLHLDWFAELALEEEQLRVLSKLWSNWLFSSCQGYRDGILASLVTMQRALPDLDQFPASFIQALNDAAETASVEATAARDGDVSQHTTIHTPLLRAAHGGTLQAGAGKEGAARPWYVLGAGGHVDRASRDTVREVVGRQVEHLLRLSETMAAVRSVLTTRQELRMLNSGIEKRAVCVLDVLRLCRLAHVEWRRRGCFQELKRGRVWGGGGGCCGEL